MADDNLECIFMKENFSIFGKLVTAFCSKGRYWQQIIICSGNCLASKIRINHISLKHSLVRAVYIYSLILGNPCKKNLLFYWQIYQYSTPGLSKWMNVSHFTCSITSWCIDNMLFLWPTHQLSLPRNHHYNPQIIPTLFPCLVCGRET